jgi:hypothetical protein
MDRGRVGDERGSKEMDRCPLTLMTNTATSGNICRAWAKSYTTTNYEMVHPD